MNKFYLLRTDSDPKIIGVNNGIKQASIKRAGFVDPQKYDKILEILGTGHHEEFKNNWKRFDFELQCVEMLPKAKLTDFLQFGPHLIHCNFLVSDKLFTLLSRKNMSPHRFFPAKVMSSYGIHIYYLPYIPNLDDNIIDFSKSVYRAGNDILGNDTCSFASPEEKYLFFKENLLMSGKEIYLNSNFDKTCDLFILNEVGIVISENLKNELEALNLASGARILPAFGNVRWPIINT